MAVRDVGEMARAGGDEHAQAGVDHEHEEEETDGEVERDSHGPVLLGEELQAGQLQVGVGH